MLIVKTLGGIHENAFMHPRKRTQRILPKTRRIRSLLAMAVSDSAAPLSLLLDNQSSTPTRQLENGIANHSDYEDFENRGDEDDDDVESTDDESRPGLAIRALATALGPGDFKEYAAHVSAYLRARLTRTEFETYACSLLTQHTVMLHNEFIFATLRLAMLQEQAANDAATSTGNSNAHDANLLGSPDYYHYTTSLINQQVPVIKRRRCTLTHEMRRSRLRREAISLPKAERDRVRREVRKLDQFGSLNALNANQFQGPFSPGAVAAIQPEYIRLLSTPTCRKDGELPSPEYLRDRMTCIAYEKGLSGITSAAADLVALGLHSHLKRILCFLLQIRGSKVAGSDDDLLTVPPGVLEDPVSTTASDRTTGVANNLSLGTRVAAMAVGAAGVPSEQPSLKKPTRKTIFPMRRRRLISAVSSDVRRAYGSSGPVGSARFTSQKQWMNPLLYLSGADGLKNNDTGDGSDVKKISARKNDENDNGDDCGSDGDVNDNVNVNNDDDADDDDNNDDDDDGDDNDDNDDDHGDDNDDDHGDDDDDDDDDDAVDQRVTSGRVRLAERKRRGGSVDAAESCFIPGFFNASEVDLTRRRYSSNSSGEQPRGARKLPDRTSSIQLVELAHAMRLRPVLFEDSRFIVERIGARLCHSPNKL